MNVLPTDQIESLFYNLDNFHRTEVLDSLISTYVNGASQNDFKRLAEAMATDHRTLIQSRFSMFLEFVKLLADNHKEGNFDARNQYACEVSTKIMAATNGAAACPLI